MLHLGVLSVLKCKTDLELMHIFLGGSNSSKGKMQKVFSGNTPKMSPKHKIVLNVLGAESYTFKKGN